MAIRKDILVELIAGPITKIILELGQGDINIFEAELAKLVAKIKNTENMVE